jgi:hypothetical protein
MDDRGQKAERPEIRNTKHEIRNKFKIQMLKSAKANGIPDPFDKLRTGMAG